MSYQLWFRNYGLKIKKRNTLKVKEFQVQQFGYAYKTLENQCTSSYS